MKIRPRYATEVYATQDGRIAIRQEQETEEAFVLLEPVDVPAVCEEMVRLGNMVSKGGSDHLIADHEQDA